MAVHARENALTKHVSHDRAYWFVFGSLAVLTVVEISLPALLHETRGLMIIALLAAAITKALGVASYYMHLRFEPKLLVWMAIGPLVFSVVLVMLIMGDVRQVDAGGWVSSTPEISRPH